MVQLVISKGKVTLEKIGEGYMNMIFRDGDKVIRIRKCKSSEIVNKLHNDTRKRHIHIQTMNDLQDFAVIQDLKSFIKPEGYIEYHSRNNEIIFRSVFYPFIDLRQIKVRNISQQKLLPIIHDIYNLNLRGYTHYDLGIHQEKLLNVELDNKDGSYRVLDLDTLRVMYVGDGSIWALSRILRDVINLHRFLVQDRFKENLSFLNKCLNMLPKNGLFLYRSEDKKLKEVSVDDIMLCIVSESDVNLNNTLYSCRRYFIGRWNHDLNKRYIHRIYKSLL